MVSWTMLKSDLQLEQGLQVGKPNNWVTIKCTVQNQYAFKSEKEHY